MTRIYSWVNIANIIGAIAIIFILSLSLNQRDLNQDFKFMIPFISAIAGWVLNDNIYGEKE
jgi:hypothetical protein